MTGRGMAVRVESSWMTYGDFRCESVSNPDSSGPPVVQKPSFPGHDSSRPRPLHTTYLFSSV